jgi:hypothetical protein
MDPSRKVLDLYGLYYLEEVVEVEEKLVILVTLVVQEQLEILVLQGQLVILVLRGLLVITLALLVNRDPVLFLLLVSLVI